MTNIRELTQKLIDDPRAADKLKLADGYIVSKHKLGRQFVLPREHAEIQPLLDKYAQDLPGFVEYVKGIRDTVVPRGNTYVSLHELYRTLKVRQTQQERRDRAHRAITWFEKKHPKATTEQKSRWLRKLEQQWGRERMQAMSDARRKTRRPRLTTAEREEVLAEFWVAVDKEIAAGDLPPL